MTFTERLELSNEYKAWLKKENENEEHHYKIPQNHETFLAFLEIKGYKIIKNEEREEE